jgi:signal transduction histidine kinase
VPINSLRPVLRSTAFRGAVGFGVALATCVALLFGFIYWQTALSETARIDSLIVDQSRLIAEAPSEQILWIVRHHLTTDLHHIAIAALFDAEGTPIEGNLRQLPSGLVPDGTVRWINAVLIDDGQPHSARLIAVARRLADGRMLVMGRTIEELSNLRHLVARALLLGLIPAVLLALAAGAWFGRRTWLRVRSWRHILNRLRDGHLEERLPSRPNGDDIDQLAEGVNLMLDELARLLAELHNVGNNMAHDLRTPLSRVRAQLERARRVKTSRDELERVIDKTIAGLDQSISITTSLLRIAEIEGTRRRDAFAPIDLVDIAREVSDFYEPAAEQKRIALRTDLAPCAPLYGDRDLLFEAVANLVDNAVKFTPEGGQVTVQTLEARDGPRLRVSDTGPGIPPALRQEVFTRFYRSDPSRRLPGFGLGLSLVAAIAKLHGYPLGFEDDDGGCTVVLMCRPSHPPGMSTRPSAQLTDEML